MPTVLPVEPDWARPRLRPQPLKPPHPGFLWSLVWCVAFVGITQTPGSILVGGAVFYEMIKNNDRYLRRDLHNPRDAADPFKMVREVMSSEPVDAALKVGMTITEILVIGFALVAIVYVVGRDWQRQLALRAPGMLHLFLVLLGFPALLVLGNGFYELLKALIESLLPASPDGMSFNLEEIMKVFGTWPWWFAVLIIGVGPGIGEELMFRGFLGRGLVARHGPVVGVLLTSLLFGAVHLIPSQALFAALIGIALHFVYLMTRSLWLPMLIHFLNNGLQMLLISENGPADLSGITHFLEKTSNQRPLHVYGGAVLLVAAVGWALYRSRTRLRDVVSDNNEPWIGGGEPAGRPWRPAFPSVAYPPEDSSTVVSHPGLDVVSWLALILAVVVCGGAWYQAYAQL